MTLGLFCTACGGAARAPAAAIGSVSDPERQAAPRYDTAERPDAVLGARDVAALERAIAGVGRDAGVALRGDGRLALLARRFARVCRAGAQASAIADEARRLGLVDPAFEIACVRASTAAALPSALASQLSAPVRALSATHFGVFVSDAQRAAVAVLTRRALALVPVPRRVDAGAPLHLRGRIDAVFAQPRVVVRGPDGEQSWPGGAGPDFDMQVPTPRAGCYRVELLARADDRVHTIAVLSAYAGDAASADACASPARAEVSTADLASLRGDLERRIAQLRSASGLPALARDAQLDRAAAQLVGGAARAGARSPGHASTAGESSLALARGLDAEGLWKSLAGDGAQRAKLLEASHTHLGVAVRPWAGAFAAAIVMARLAPAGDLELAPARLLDAINRNRGTRGAPALRPDATLTRVARRSAEAFFARPSRSEREIVAEANAELERFGLSYRRVAALAMLVVDPLDAAALEPALEAGAGAAGIAVAQGFRDDTAARRLAVVIALGWER